MPDAASSTSAHASHLIVGAGAAGTLVAANLLRTSQEQQRPARIVLVDPRPVAEGVAYSTRDERHLLNVRASDMSAYPDDPDDLLRWLGRHEPALAQPTRFIPRMVFHRYLRDTLADAAQRAGATSLDMVRARVVRLSLHGNQRWNATLADGRVLTAAHVVLALGHLGVSTDWAPGGLADSPRFVTDPWAPGALQRVPEGDLLIVGTGLTMVDVVSTLRRPGRRIHVMSRHGILPRAHTEVPVATIEPPPVDMRRLDLGELRATFATHVRRSVRFHHDWRPAVDSLRPLAQAIWLGLSPSDRAEFVRTDSRIWETVRHRVPNASATVIAEDLAAGSLIPHRGEVVAATSHDTGLTVRLSGGSLLDVAAVVNCTGPSIDPRVSVDPLVESLQAHGLARPGPFALGFETDVDGRLVRVDGAAHPSLWTIGSLRRGMLWESTAIPEIRVQAAQIARASLPRGRGSSDVTLESPE